MTIIPLPEALLLIGGASVISVGFYFIGFANGRIDRR